MTFDYDINKCDCTPIRIEFEEFIYQSKTRGIKIKNSSLKIELVKSIEGGPAARTYHSKNLIRIDTTKYNWNSFLRQKLIYHELAHFYLKRSHENNTFYYDGKNVPISLMSERTKIDFNGSSDELKEHYWNELFYNK
jgi:hypothetical protein